MSDKVSAPPPDAEATAIITTAVLAILRLRRMECNIESSEVAKRMHIDQGNVSRWEMGRRVPNTHRMVQWSRALDLRPSAVFSAAEKVAYPEGGQPWGDLSEKLATIADPIMAADPARTGLAAPPALARRIAQQYAGGSSIETLQVEWGYRSGTILRWLIGLEVPFREEDQDRALTAVLESWRKP